MKRKLYNSMCAVLLAFSTVTALWTVQAQATVALTKHNLSTTGPGTIKSAEAEVCVFCHTPHNSRIDPTGSLPLWNRKASTATYLPYTSTTTKATIGAPTGSSLLCLSCHDGTIALGELLSRGASRVALSGVDASGFITGPGKLGADLRDDHPISFKYDAALVALRGELANPNSLPAKVKLDANGQMQCVICHDAHDDTNGKFLVIPNTSSALCTTCHTKTNWVSSSHATSASTWNGLAPDPWPDSTATTVAANSCENCHKPHSAPSGKWLVNSASEETTCYNCHNGHVASSAKNIQNEMAKASAHPVAAFAGTHDPSEPIVTTTRHVECSDCHNPHQTKAIGTSPPGPLTGVRGVDINGAEVPSVTREEQLCFRCHGDSTNKPAAPTVRQIVQTNTRLEFQTTNPSFHPVAGPRNGDGYSLTVASGLTGASTITCSSCHNNNSGPSNGGTGANGPHGSNIDNLLERGYATTNTATESLTTYALCYKCHDRTKVTSGDAHLFKEHDKHLGKDITCNACHDPHGVSATQGTVANNSKLINFNSESTAVGGVIRWVAGNRGATRTGSCTLACHGKTHNNTTY